MVVRLSSRTDCIGPRLPQCDLTGDYCVNGTLDSEKLCYCRCNPGYVGPRCNVPAPQVFGSSVSMKGEVYYLEHLSANSTPHVSLTFWFRSDLLPENDMDLFCIYDTIYDTMYCMKTHNRKFGFYYLECMAIRVVFREDKDVAISLGLSCSSQLCR